MKWQAKSNTKSCCQTAYVAPNYEPDAGMEMTRIDVLNGTQIWSDTQSGEAAAVE